MGGRAWTRAGGRAAGAGLAGRPSVFRARGSGRPVAGLLLDLGPAAEAGRAGSPRSAA